MTASALLQTGAGILVSIVLFLIGYRQTIGARKERAKAANAALIRALTRRLVLENYAPQDTDLARLIKGKALEYQVRVTDLLAIEQLVSIVYANVFDSELIAPDHRADVEQRLTRISEPEGDGVSAVEGRRHTKNETSWTFILALAMTASAVGALTVIAPDLLRGELLDPKQASGVALAVVTSLLAIFAIVILRRGGEAAGMLTSFFEEEDIAVEARIKKILDRMELKYERDLRIGRFGFADFVVAAGDRRVLIDARPWKLAPINMLEDAVACASRMKAPAEVNDVVVVVDDDQVIPESLARGDVRVIPVGTLRDYLESLVHVTAA